MPFSGTAASSNGNRKVGREFAHLCSDSQTLMTHFSEILELLANPETLHRDLDCLCALSQILHHELTITRSRENNNPIYSRQRFFHLGLNPRRPCLALR